MFARKQKSPDAYDRRRTMAGIPVLHGNVSIHDNGNGTVTVHVEEPRGTRFWDRFRPAVTVRRFELDAFGTFVLRQVEARKDVLHITRAFEKQFGMNRREAELGVVAFLNLLMKRRVVSLAVRKAG